MQQLKISFVVLLLACTTVFTATAQTADEIVQKHIAAIGGADNWKKIKSMKMTASMNAQGMEIPISMVMLHKKGFKSEFTVGDKTGYSIVTDKAGWSFNPFMGQTKPDPMTAEAVKEMQPQLDLQGPLVDYKTKGNKIAYLGKDDVEGTECHKLKVTYPSGKEQTMYFDATTYYEIKAVEKSTADGKEVESVSLMSNYKKLPEGIVMPMTMDIGMGAMDIKSIEINKDVAESTFVPKN